MTTQSTPNVGAALSQGARVQLFTITNNKKTAGGLTSLLPWTPGWVPPESALVPKEEWTEGKNDSLFFSGCEGVAGAIRVNATENPAIIVNGVFGDYDHTLTLEQALDFLASPSNSRAIKPTYIGSSTSGKIKAFWEFVHPVRTNSHALSKEFLHQFSLKARMNILLPGLDESCLLPHQLQHCGKNWVPVPGASPVASDTLFATLFIASSKMGPRVDRTFSEIPFANINEEVHKHWPNAPEITDGAMVNLFWLAEDDPTKTRAAKVCPSGIVCFSDRAGTTFLSWNELFKTVNPDFVKNFTESCTARILRDFYYDGVSYWSRLSHDDTAWKPRNREQVKSRLADAGLSSNKRKGETETELNRALIRIEDLNGIKCAGHFFFNTSQVIYSDGGEAMLNVSALRSRWTEIDPDGNLVPERDFPFIWSFVYGMWDPYLDHGVHPGDYFVNWLRRDMKAIRRGNGLPTNHALVITGNATMGKTFIAKRLLSPMYGGFRPAEEYIRGITNYNGDLVRAPLWIIDDPLPANDKKTRDTISSRIKTVIAGGSIQVNEKYEKSYSIEVRPRVVLICNSDEMSASVIPSVTGSHKDKVSLLMVRKDFRADFDQDEDINNARIAKEIPRFVSWLLGTPDLPVDQKDRDAVRWGSKTYTHPLVVESSHDNDYGTSDDTVLLLGLCHLLPTLRDAHPTDDTLPFYFNELQSVMESGLVEGIPHSYTRDCRKYSQTLARWFRDEVHKIPGGEPWLSRGGRHGKGNQYIIHLAHLPPELAEALNPKTQTTTIG